jgi:hypothetical protein
MVLLVERDALSMLARITTTAEIPALAMQVAAFRSSIPKIGGAASPPSQRAVGKTFRLSVCDVN